MDFKEQVKKGFSSCKIDIEDLRIENTSLKNKVFDLQFQNEGINSKMDKLLIQFKELNDTIKNYQNQNVNSQISKPIINKPLKNKDPYEALLAFKAKANKREMLKQKLLSMIGDSGNNLSELKFMFVDHFKYCSKATFYNYLKELELEKTVNIKRINSKNIIYMNKISREI